MNTHQSHFFQQDNRTQRWRLQSQCIFLFRHIHSQTRFGHSASSRPLVHTIHFPADSAVSKTSTEPTLFVVQLANIAKLGLASGWLVTAMISRLFRHSISSRTVVGLWFYFSAVWIPLANYQCLCVFRAPFFYRCTIRERNKQKIHF